MKLRGKSFGLAALFLGVSLSLSACEDPDFVRRIDTPPPIESNNSYTVQDLVAGKAEILWVIDNSGSMDSYQREVMRNMDVFIQGFTQTAAGADWRMGLISTDIGQSPFIGFTASDRLDNTDPNPVQRFNWAIQRLGQGGSNTERAFEPIQRAFTNFPDFLRQNSELFIVIVSDEREQSSGTVQDFINYLHSIRPPASISTYGIFEMSENGCGNERFQGSRYGDFITQTNGLAFPICAADYGQGLAAFGADIAQKIVVPKIYLASAPIIDTLQVLYQGAAVPGGPAEEGGFWLYNTRENAVFFHDLSFLNGPATENVQIIFEQARPPEIDDR